MSKDKPTKTRVAVYIRIGGTGEYAMNYDMQTRYFTDMIAKNPDWELAGFYADLGAESRKQPKLKHLMADCRAGRIDLIITKSAARISRSMYTVMKIVRELAYLKPPVGIFFEDSQLNTLQKDNFLLLTMLEVLATDEKATSANLSLKKQLKMKALEKAKTKKEDGDDE
jgi:DNA invertase Pin-like site-specific DNA recombinase